MNFQEAFMFSVTDRAKAQLDSYFEGKEKSPIRIFLSSGGCSGPRLSLALDDAKDTDDVFPVEGYSFIVEKELMAKAAPMAVDLSPMGFEITSSLELGGGGCGCSGSCSSGSCS